VQLKHRRRLLSGLAVLFGLPLALVVSLRAMRDRAEAPVLVRGSLYRLRNLFTELYAARVGGKVILFDAGIDTEGHALDALLSGLKATRGDVTDVFLTHGHFDHVAASPLCTRAHIHVGEADVDMLARRVSIEPAAPRWIERILPVGPIEADAPLARRTQLPVGDGVPLTAIPMPGHTRGSYAFYFDGVLIAGDSIQISDGKLELASSPFSQDMAANRRSIAALKTELAGLPVDVVCTGHQGCTPAGDGGRLLDDLIARASR
jgi:glyoxylase-like metal-dependent hydrolase (beta-lactamase superfamily II)